jgi:tetratricopeptide (TPR) repeat protein
MFAATDRAKEAGQAYDRAVELEEKLVHDDAFEPRFRMALALMYESRAGLYQTTDRPEKAEEAYSQAQVLLKRLADEQPKKPTCRQCLAENWDRLGLFLESTGRAQEAEKAFEQSLQQKQKLAADFPNLGYYRYLLALGQKDLGHRSGAMATAPSRTRCTSPSAPTAVASNRWRWRICWATAGKTSSRSTTPATWPLC